MRICDRKKTFAETVARIIFLICAVVSILALISITFYMMKNGLPAFQKVGVKEILFETEWMPTAKQPLYGIAFVIMTSLVGTLAAIILGVPIALLTAVFLVEVAPKKLAAVVKPAVELLAGIPSVIYGLLGIMLLNPIMYQLELAIFKNSDSHQFTGGSNLLSAVIVLTIMILPTVVTMTESALRAVPASIKAASLALGATKIQTVFRVLIPAAKSGIATAIVLGTGRAVGEAMAITLVAGSSVNLPLPFNSVRFLTSAIVSEMGYAEGTHRQVLFSIGLVLFAMIMGLNYLLMIARKKGGAYDANK